jgi:hypothetical protein
VSHEFQGENYQFAVSPCTNILTAHETKFISDKGYTIPQCYMTRALAKRFGVDYTGYIAIIYLAGIKSIGQKICMQRKEWYEKTLLTSEQNKLLQ